jgi:hypothetical protein
MTREIQDKETIIIWNPVDKMAQVWTYERPLQKYIEERLHILPKEIHGRKEHDGGRDYEVPKKFVSIRAPKKMKLTSAQRRAIGERLHKGKKVASVKPNRRVQ